MALTHWIAAASNRGVPNSVLIQQFGDEDYEILVRERRLSRRNEFAAVNRFGGYARRVLTSKADELTLRGDYNQTLWAGAQRTDVDKGVDAFGPVLYYLDQSTIVRYGARRNRRRGTGVADGDFQVYSFDTARWIVTAVNIDDQEPYEQIFQRRNWEITLARVA